MSSQSISCESDTVETMPEILWLSSSPSSSASSSSSEVSEEVQQPPPSSPPREVGHPSPIDIEEATLKDAEVIIMDDQITGCDTDSSSDGDLSHDGGEDEKTGNCTCLGKLRCSFVFIISALFISGLLLLCVPLLTRDHGSGIETHEKDDTDGLNVYPKHCNALGSGDDFTDLDEYYLYLLELIDPEGHQRLKLYEKGAFAQALEWMAYREGGVCQYRLGDDGDDDDGNEEVTLQFIKQRFGLLVLYFETGGDTYWNFKVGERWLEPIGKSECLFDGITCNDETGKISNIELKSRPLVGTLPSEFALSLQEDLRVLNLEMNRLRGEIPSNLLTACTKLQVLRLDSNFFSGDVAHALPFYPTKQSNENMETMLNATEGTYHVPEVTHQSLQVVSLRHNFFEGTLPGSTTLPPKLRVLNLRFNHLTGSLPNNWFTIPTNQRQLRKNLLGGSSPTRRSYSNDVFRDISSESEPPTEAFSKLDFTFDGTSDLQGGEDDDDYVSNYDAYIPGDGYDDDAHPLDLLIINDNFLTGTIPTSIGSFANLHSLDVGHNNFDGTLPTELGRLSNLEWLGIPQLQMDGELPTELYRITSLRYLVMAFSTFNFTLSSQMKAWTALEQFLAIGCHNLSGTIPTEVGTLTNLRSFVITQSDISGPVPKEFNHIPRLDVLWLSENNLSGSLPLELCDTVSLRVDCESFDICCPN